MSTIHNKVPDPIVNEHYLRNGDGSHLTVGSPFRGDRFDLSTGECSVARIIGGIRQQLAVGSAINVAAHWQAEAQVLAGSRRELELVEMTVVPGEGALDGNMQIPERVAIRNLDARQISGWTPTNSIRNCKTRD